MGEFLASLREFNTVSVVLRMVLAVICGGLIGVERESKRRPAGFRTHTLVCLGAQVVAGIGFIGAGTIIVTRRRQVKGLTTAAGLWVSAIIGLAIGTGFYEGAIIAMVFVLVAEILLSKIEWYISSKAKSVNVYVEYTETESIAEIAEEIKKLGVGIMDIEITRARAAEGPMMSAIFALQLGNKVKRNQVLSQIQEIKGILSIEEL